MDEVFKTRLNDKDIELYGEDMFKQNKDEVINPVSAVVSWGITVDAREWGVKSIDKYLMSFEMELVRLDFDDNEIEKIKLSDKDLDVSFDAGTSGCLIRPESIEVDFKTKKAIVKMS